MPANLWIKQQDSIIQVMKRLIGEQAKGILRPKSMKSLAIRFRCTGLDEDSEPPRLIIGKISPAGMEKLRKKEVYLFEINSQQKRIAFNSKIVSMKDGQVKMALPTAVLESERRKSRRVSTDNRQCIFYSPDSWPVDGHDIDAPPVFGLYENIARFMKVIDISAGGFGLETAFPSFYNFAETQGTFDIGRILFPLKPQIQVSAQLCWSKRARKSMVNEEVPSYIERNHRLGFKFLEPSPELTEQVENFVARFPRGNPR